MATLAKSLAECTATAGLEAHDTSPTFRSYGNFIPHPAGNLSRPSGDVASPAGGGHVPQEVCEVRQEVDKVRQEVRQVRQATFTSSLGWKGLVSESRVMPDSTTDHRPVVTTRGVCSVKELFYLNNG
jgi:hypothetical protein